jgi:hypothetical protein
LQLKRVLLSIVAVLAAKTAIKALHNADMNADSAVEVITKKQPEKRNGFSGCCGWFAVGARRQAGLWLFAVA